MFLELGSLCSTRGIADLQAENPKFSAHVEISFQRYVHCDWGDLCEEDAEMNNNALSSDGGRILAAYEHPEHPEWRIWIIKIMNS